jgi:two-component sensor histidine kinase
MEHISYVINDLESFEKFLYSKEIAKNANYENILVQIYTATTETTILEKKIKLIKKYLPHSIIVGVSSVGEIAFGKTYIQSTVVGFSFFESTQLKIIKQEFNATQELQAAQTISNEINNIDEKIAGTLLLTTPLSIDAFHFLNKLDIKDQYFPIFGGGAGVYANKQNGLIFSSSWFSESGAIAVVFLGEDLKIDCYSYLGWKPLSKQMTITKVEGMTIKTIDNRPAFEIYDRYLGLPKDENFFLNVLEFPLLLQRDDQIIARVPVSVDDDGGIVFVADIFEGETFEIGYGDPHCIISDASKVHKRVDDTQVEAVFLYTCGCRRFLMQEEVEQETLPFEKIAPTFGFYTYGEFFALPYSDIQLLNSTMVVTSFTEKKKVAPKKVVSPQLTSSSDNLDDPYLNKHSRIISRLVYFIQATTDEITQQNKRLSALVEEREVLLRELHHRVKNNFHAIIGILSLAKMKSKDASLEYDEAINRISAMSQIHEELCLSTNLADIDTQSYLENIIKKIASLYQELHIEMYLDKLTVDFEIATNIGAIINELITNTHKHNQQKTDNITIKIWLKKIDDEYHFIYCDNGKGFDMENITKGLGLTLIKKFSSKLNNAHYSFVKEAQGICFKLSFT